MLLQHTQKQPQQTGKSVCPVELCVLIRYIILIAQHMGKIALPLQLHKIKYHRKTTLYAISVNIKGVHCYMLEL